MADRAKSVHLGYEVGSGRAVEIPVGHAAAAGQTQHAGKTTALEALIDRAQCRAITFVTKRGEGSFTKARRILPYFKDQGDWQYVASILEASRGEKLKFERAWIIRASKGARTLAEVHNNVRDLLKKRATGKDADVYTCLDAYLEIVVPEISRVKWAPKLELQPGVNAMDLGALPLEMQHLVIRSAINWVLEHEQNTVVVVPESWKFIPQGRGTPVKLAAEAFIRQGATLGNYLWLDSQDLGGVEKAILRSVSVWLLGVQREANEIKRTLANIPAGTAKPSAADIALLGLGQFFACWGPHAIKTYVQPAWMTADEARAVATLGPQRQRTHPPAPPAKEEPEMCELHEKLERELEDLRAEALSRLKAIEKLNGDVSTLRNENHVQRAELSDFRTLKRILGSSGVAAAAAGGAPVDEEALIRKVLARVPSGGGGPITITPPEKLRKDFQREESERIVAAARELEALGRRVLKLLESLEGGYLSQKAIAERLGRSTGGGSWITLTTQVKGLVEYGFVKLDGKRGVCGAVRSKIAADLAAYGASEAEVEAVFQDVLYQLASEAAAVA